MPLSLNSSLNVVKKKKKGIQRPKLYAIKKIIYQFHRQ